MWACAASEAVGMFAVVTVGVTAAFGIDSAGITDPAGIASASCSAVPTSSAAAPTDAAGVPSVLVVLGSATKATASTLPTGESFFDCHSNEHYNAPNPTSLLHPQCKV